MQQTMRDALQNLEVRSILKLAVKCSNELAEVRNMNAVHTSANQVQISARDGQVLVHGGDGDGAVVPARLAWPKTVTVKVDGRLVEGNACNVTSDARVMIDVASVLPEVKYLVTVARDRMDATLRVEPRSGLLRVVTDAAAATSLTLEVVETPAAAPQPALADALAQIQAAGISFGLDRDAVAAALATPSREYRIAEGSVAVEGRPGRIEDLVDFEQLRQSGVPVGTPLLRRVRKRDGRNGTDVTGKCLAVAPVSDAQLRAGPGVELDAEQVMASAAVAGAPYSDGNGRVEVRQELELEVVDGTTGDIEFHGSVRVFGDVAEGRSISAQGDLTIDGKVDRARIECGGHLTVHGAIMSSTLRAGGERAVSARMLEFLSTVPRELAEVATHARELRDAAQQRGSDISHGLSVQLVIERMYGGVLSNLMQAAAMLNDVGGHQTRVAEDVSRWHGQLKTAAINNLTDTQMEEMVQDCSNLVEEAHRAIRDASNMTVSYMQASEAEATGSIRVVGKGIFNSNVSGWGGVTADNLEAVIRGGAVTSNGDVCVREVGCPGGARMMVTLGAGANLSADHVYAGTVVVAPGFTHRFAADRSDVRAVMTNGSISVESLAA